MKIILQLKLKNLYFQKINFSKKTKRKILKMQSKIINSLKILKFFINNDILDQKFF